MREFMNGGTMMWSMVCMSMIWIFVIAAVVMFSRQSWSLRSPFGQAHPKKAMEILEERYARGDLARDEFEQKKRDITGT